MMSTASAITIAIGKRSAPGVEDGPAAENQELSTKEAAVHVLGMFKGTLSGCGHQVLNVALDKNFLQQHNIESLPFPDLLSNEPVSDVMYIQHKFSHATAILLQKQKYFALGSVSTT